MVRASPGTSIARPAWYDRNPAEQTRSYEAANVAPHSVTERWSYTVPAGKKAWVELAWLMACRQTAATTLGTVIMDFIYTPSGGSAIILAEVFHYNNTVYAKEVVPLTVSIHIKAGDKISLNTADSSTGGTMNYLGKAKVTEFTA